MTTADGARAPAPPIARTATSLTVCSPAPPTAFDAVTITLHWVTAALVLALFAAGWSIDRASDGDTARRLLTLHRSLGVVVWGLAILRLGWRAGGARLPPLPAATPPVQKLAARLNEYALLALLVVQPLTGAAQSLYRGKAFALFAWQVPGLVARDRAMVALFHSAHAWGAWALAALIGLHATAALLHGVVLRDGVLERMIPLRTPGWRRPPL